MKRYQNISDVSEPSQARQLRVLMLADDQHPANVVKDHIQGFLLSSRHHFQVINPIHQKFNRFYYIKRFDVILIHYSIYILGEYFLPPEWAHFVKVFKGLKAQIIQDEHRHINAMKQRMSELGISVVFSSLEVKTMEKVYASLPVNACFYSCLPGYIPECLFDLKPPPIGGRALDVVYRGRTLPAQLGKHAQEKREIGEMMLNASERYGLKVDIACDEERRIYGDAWLSFLMSGKSTLGVEGGVSIFDFEGSLESLVNLYIQVNSPTDFDEVWSKLLQRHEKNIVHKTITPKIFEAIAAKTALILFPGKYRGIIEPDIHYIALHRDGSNLTEVVQRLRDNELLQSLVDNAYEDIMSREDLTKGFYVRKVDAVLTIKATACHGIE